MKKFLALLLAALMLLAAIPALAEEAPTEITIFYTGTGDADRNSYPLLKVFEEKTNTKLKIVGYLPITKRIRNSPRCLPLATKSISSVTRNSSSAAKWSAKASFAPWTTCSSTCPTS